MKSNRNSITQKGFIKIQMIYPQQQTATVQVPATTANLGVGFDTFGLALNLYNTFTFKKETLFSFQTSSHSPIELPTIPPQTDCPSNLIFDTFRLFYKTINQPLTPISVEATVNIPLGRGLGSSATAVVAALVGANQLEGNPLSTQALLELAIAIEGHPDNVAPALLGGFQLCDAQTALQLDWCKTWQFLALIPTFQTETEAARKTLPETYPRSTVVQALRNSAMFIEAVRTQNPALLKTIFERDSIHEPYRGQAIAHFDSIRKAVSHHPAVLGTVISGSGPTVLICYEDSAQAEILELVETVAKPFGLTLLPLTIDLTGARIMTTYTDSQIECR
jgi:homoserine kinase